MILNIENSSFIHSTRLYKVFSAVIKMFSSIQPTPELEILASDSARDVLVIFRTFTKSCCSPEL